MKTNKKIGSLLFPFHLVTPIYISNIFRKSIISLNSSNLGTKKFSCNHIRKNKAVKIAEHFSFYLENIQRIITENENKNVKQIQSLIEYSWIDIIKDLHKDKAYLSSKYSYSLNKKVLEANENLNIMFETGIMKRKFPVLYPFLNKIELLMLTFGIVISTISTDIGYTNLCGILGKKIVWYIYLNDKIDLLNIPTKNLVKNSNLIKDNYLYQDFIKEIKIDDMNILLLGDFYLDVLMKYPSDIFERIFDRKEGLLKNEPARIRINPKHFGEIRKNLIVDPASLPMVCEPENWGEKSFGGYLVNKVIKEDIITGSTFHGHIMLNRNIVYNAINIMSKVKFGINKSLFNYLNSEGCYLFYEKLNKSEELQKITNMQIAQTISNTPFYLPLNCDWRGRIYTVPFYLDYQGGDLSLSLLEFWDGETLTPSGLNNLYIYGANNYNQNNISKDTYPNRINWVKENMDQIIKMDPEFMLKADNKFVFASFCLAMKELKKDPSYKVKLPVFLDATCSGIQHISGIMKDLQLASEVNLIPQDDSKGVEDIYTKFKTHINEAIREYGRNNEAFKVLVYVDLERKEVKPLVMIQPYNAKQRGIRDMLASILKKVESKNKNPYLDTYLAPSIKKGELVELNLLDLNKIAEIINKSIFTKYSALKNIYEYLINFTKLINNLEIPVIWTTPTGLEIVQSYYKSKQNKVAINFGGKTKKMVLREWTENINKSKQIGGIIPNIIHSLDASHLMNVILTSNELKLNNVITVHDCFGTHPNNMDALAKIVKIKFIELYTHSNFLETFHARNKQNILDHKLDIFKDEITGNEYVLLKRTKFYIPNTPKLGNLDLSKIIHSKYIIT